MSRAAAGTMRKKYKTLPFESKKPPRGRLLCEAAQLRVDPVDMVAMGQSQLADICGGLLENEHVRFLDLDGNMLGLAVEDGESPLGPLLNLVCKNKVLRGVDISNNSLSFDAESVLTSVRKIILESNLTLLIIGGNLDIDDKLVVKLAGLVSQSKRRWRGISVGSVDNCYREVEDLKQACRESTAAAERSMIEAYFAVAEGQEDEGEETVEVIPGGGHLAQQQQQQQQQQPTPAAQPAAAAEQPAATSSAAEVTKRAHDSAGASVADAAVAVKPPPAKKARSAPKLKGPACASDERSACPRSGCCSYVVAMRCPEALVIVGSRQLRGLCAGARLSMRHSIRSERTRPPLKCRRRWSRSRRAVAAAASGAPRSSC